MYPFPQITTHVIPCKYVPDNQIFDKILWINTVMFDKIIDIHYKMKQSHTIIINTNRNMFEHEKTALIQILMLFPSNVKKLSFVGSFVVQSDDKFYFSRDLTHIDFGFNSMHHVPIPKMSHCVSSSAQCENNPIFSKAITHVSFKTIIGPSLIFPKNIKILIHDDRNAHYPNMSKNLKYLQILSVTYVQFNLSKNIYHLNIFHNCTCPMSLPKHIKIFKFPTSSTYNFSLPKRMIYLGIIHRWTSNTILPEDLNELHFKEYCNFHLSVSLNEPTIYYVRDNVPNGIKTVKTDIFVKNLFNKPNTMIK